MLKILFSLLIAVIALVGCDNNNTQNNKCIISGHTEIDSLNGKWIYIVESLKNFDNVIDSAKIENNTFKAECVNMVSPYKVPMLLTYENKELVKPLFGTYLVIEPGKINVEIKSNGEIFVTGTPLNDMIYTCEKAMSDFNAACADIYNMDLPAQEKQLLMNSARTVRNSEMLKPILENINNDITVSILREKYMYFEPDQLDSISKNIDPTMMSPEEHSLYAAARKTAIGTQYTDMELTDINGNAIKISDYVGKQDYLILDFWASWCGPCMRALPALQEIYNNTSREKLEIIGISLDTDRTKWKNTVNKHDIKWINASSLEGWNSAAAKTYSISFIPSTVVIDRNGVIVSRNANLDALKIMLQ